MDDSALDRAQRGLLPEPTPDGDFDEDDEEEDEDDEDEEDDEEEEEDKQGRKRLKQSSFFMDEAEDSEEDEEEMERLRDKEKEDDLTEVQRQRLKQRLEQKKRFQDRPAEEIARELEERARQQAVRRPSGVDYGRGGAAGVETARATDRRPTTDGPKLFMVGCKPGKERNLVVQIMNKFIANSKRPPAPMSDETVSYNRYITSTTKSALGPNGEFLIFSAVASGTKGYLYIEAMREDHVKAAVHGLDGIYAGKMSIVPLEQMTDVLKVDVRKESVRKDQLVRLTRFPYKGDLAKVVHVLDAGARVWVLTVPRLDYIRMGLAGTEDIKAHNAKKIRPPSKMFNAAEVAKAGGRPTREVFPLLDEELDQYDGLFFQHGFVFLNLSVKQITELKAAPSLEEQRIFTALNAQGAGDDEAALEGLTLGAAVAAAPRLIYGVHDKVRIAAGEQRGATGTIVSVDDHRQIAVVQLSEDYASMRIDVRFADLEKTFDIGAHVKVLAGKHAGVTGTLVQIKDGGPRAVAVIYKDEGGDEVQAFVSNLKVTTEVAAGLDSLSGYRLYDLVMVGNQLGCVIRVGTSTLRVLTQLDEIQEVAPAAIRGKKNEQNKALSAMDKLGQSLHVGDSVVVLNGLHAGLEGQIKHVHRSQLFVHCRMRPQNSGIIVIKALDTKLAGTSVGSAAVASAVGASGAGGGRGGKPGGPGGARKGDELLNKLVRIRAGQYKGLQGMVTRADEDKATVELDARPHPVRVRRADLEIIGDRNGEFAVSSSTERKAFSYAVPAGGGGAAPAFPMQAHSVATPLQTPGPNTPSIMATPGPVTPSGTPGAHTPRVGTPGSPMEHGPLFKMNDRVRLQGTSKIGTVKGVTGSDVIVAYIAEDSQRPRIKIEKASELVLA